MTAKLVKFVALAVLLALPAACGEFTREGRSPSIVVVDSLSKAGEDTRTILSDVLTNGTTFNDLAEIQMSLVAKDPGVPGIGSAPSPLNSVTINRYRVTYRRTDGRNVQGVDVPYAFDSAMTFTISGETVGKAVFQIVRNSAKLEAPLKALATSVDVISTIAEVTFYGRDQAGNDVSAVASIGIDFANFADPQ